MPDHTSEDQQDALYLKMVAEWMTPNELAMLKGLQKIDPDAFLQNREHWFTLLEAALLKETAILNGLT